jgi:hypothetical protein
MWSSARRPGLRRYSSNCWSIDVAPRVQPRPRGFPTPRGLTVGFPVRHLGRNLLARHLARDVSHGLLIKPLGLLFFLLPLPLRPSLVVAAGAVGLVQVGPEEVYGDGEDDAIRSLAYLSSTTTCSNPGLAAPRSETTAQRPRGTIYAGSWIQTSENLSSMRLVNSYSGLVLLHHVEELLTIGHDP